MAIKAAFLSSPVSYTALDFRAVENALLTAGGTPLAPRAGVLEQTGAEPLQATSAGNRFIAISAGQAVVDKYIVTNDAVANVTVAAGGATARIDAIVLRVYDLGSGDSKNDAVIEVITGTATAPAVPPRALLLAHVAVAAGVNAISQANITDRRVYTATKGGVFKQTGVQAVNPTVPAGQPVYDPANDTIYQKSNTGTFKRIAPMHSGVIPNMSPLKGGTNFDLNEIRTIAGQFIITTSAGGHVSVPTSFSKTLLWASCQNADPGNADTLGGCAFAIPDLAILNTGPEMITFRLFNAGGGYLPNWTSRLNVILVGC